MIHSPEDKGKRPLDLPGTSDEEVTAALKRLFNEEGEEPSSGRTSFVPGAGASAPPPPSFPAISIRSLANLLEASAEQEGSALAKSRSQLVASRLRQKQGDDDRALSLALSAFETSPKLGVAALMLRKQARAAGDDELVDRSLEDAARLVQSGGARAHSHLLLVDRAAHKGDLETAGKLLDQAAREGSRDEALLLQRAVVRLSSGGSLAGLKVPLGLEDALHTATELLDGRKAPAPSPNSRQGGQSAALAPLRAARALCRGAFEEALDLLGESAPIQDDPQAEALSDLRAAFKAAEPRGAMASLSELKAAAQKAPRRNLLRGLALRSIECGDKSTLSWLLSVADPAGGTFDVNERWFLAACANDRFSLNAQDALVLRDTAPELAAAAGPSDLYATQDHDASDAQLLAQIGAGFLRSGAENKAVFPLSQAAQEALSRLEEQGQWPALCGALSLLEAQTQKNGLEIAQRVAQLSYHLGFPSGHLIAGALLGNEGSREESQVQFERVLAEVPTMAVAARRGLLHVNAGSGEIGLQAIEESLQCPQLVFATMIERAAQSKNSEEQARILFSACRHLAQASGHDAQRLEVLRHLSCSLLAKAGQPEEARSERERLMAWGSRLARATHVRALFEGMQLGSPAGLSELDDSVDLSERLLVYWAEAQPDRVTVRPAPLDDAARAPTAGELTAVESLLNMVQAFATNRPDRVDKYAPGCGGLDSTIALFADDLGELRGVTAGQSTRWLTFSQEAIEEGDRRHAYERLAELDELRGDTSSALLWQRTLIEKFPGHLASLLRLEESLLLRQDPGSFGTNQPAAALPPDDREPYALLHGCLAVARSDLRSAKNHLAPLLDRGPARLIALRSLATIYRERREDEQLFECLQALAETSGHPLDKACRCLSAALVAARLGREDEAKKWSQAAIAAEPRAFAAQQLNCFLTDAADAHAVGKNWEALAECARAPEHRAQIWFECAQAWDAAGEPESCAEALEKVLKDEPTHAQAFAYLKAEREASGSEDEVEALIQSRLEYVHSGSEEQFELESQLAAILEKKGDLGGARDHLARALVGHPDRTILLEQHARLSITLGSHDAAERSLVALRDQLPPSSQRTQVVRLLGQIYYEHLRQWERAMDAFEFVLTDRPGDSEAIRCLVDIYGRLGLAERATSLQTSLIKAAESPEEKRAGALVLADLYERVAGDPKRAEATLERVRKAWPLDADVLEATVLFMDRHGVEQGRAFMLDRARKDARRKLEGGRIDAGLLDTLSRVARLSGEPMIAQSTAAARAAFLGLPEDALDGMGSRVLSEVGFDDSVAPPSLSVVLRELLRKTGPAMDAAFSVDLSNRDARALSWGPSFDRVQELTSKTTNIPELFVSDHLGARCLPITTQPPRLLLGASVDTLPPLERDYLLVRALKLLTTGVGALARSKEDDRWPMLAALLHLFAPNWTPPGVDLRKAAQAKALIEQGLARVGYDDDVPVLALEAIGSIGNQVESFGGSVRLLANRTAFLAVGGLSTTLRAMAAGEGKELAVDGPSRFRWLEAHPEAKDLVLFSTTEQCARARERWGIHVQPARSVSLDPSTNGATTDVVGRPSPPRRS